MASVFLSPATQEIALPEATPEATTTNPLDSPSTKKQKTEDEQEPAAADTKYTLNNLVGYFEMGDEQALEWGESGPKILNAFARNFSEVHASFAQVDVKLGVKMEKMAAQFKQLAREYKEVYKRMLELVKADPNVEVTDPSVEVEKEMKKAEEESQKKEKQAESEAKAKEVTEA